MTNTLVNFSNLLSKIVENKTSIVNCLITLQIFGLERVSSNSIFRCPCYEETDAGSFFYGFTFLVAPAFVLFIVGYLANPSTTRLLTGLTRRKKKFSSARRRSFNSIMLRATIAPFAWLSIALLDGKYAACALTSHPYSTTCEDFYKDQRKPAIYSMEFEQNRTRSQIFGWGLMSVVFIMGAGIYTWRRYTSTISHWQRQYVMLTKQIEREQFEKLSTDRITKAAEENINNFLTTCQSKKDYDEITDLYISTDNSNKLCYSALQNWCEEHSIAMAENKASNGDSRRELDLLLTKSADTSPV